MGNRSVVVDAYDLRDGHGLPLVLYCYSDGLRPSSFLMHIIMIDREFAHFSILPRWKGVAEEKTCNSHANATIPKYASSVD